MIKLSSLFLIDLERVDLLLNLFTALSLTEGFPLFLTATDFKQLSSSLCPLFKICCCQKRKTLLLLIMMWINSIANLFFLNLLKVNLINLIVLPLNHPLFFNFNAIFKSVNTFQFPPLSLLFFILAKE